MLRKGNFVLIFFLLFIHFCSAQNFVSKENVKYDSAIEDLFYSIETRTNLSLAGLDPEFKDIYKTSENFYDLNVKEDRIYVSVTIRDNSGIVYNGTKEERHEQWEIQNEWYKNEINKITDTLNEDEFTLYRKNPVSFSGFITNKGFEKLKNMEDIESIELNYLGKSTVADSVPLINADNVWDLGYTGAGVDVCIIDGGLKNNWSIIFDNIEDEYCYCDHSFLPGGCCPNGDTIDTSARKDETGHGTLNAGIIASNLNGDKGIAPDTNIYLIKIMANILLDEDQYTNDDLESAIAQCINWGVDIISFSGGDYDSDCSVSDIDTLINQATNNNILFVASSGNGGNTNKILHPACRNNVLSVGATYDDTFDRAPETGNYPDANCYDSGSDSEVDDLTCFTDRNSNLDLLAPGYYTSLFSIMLDQQIGGYGTSQAAPHVAGAAALLLQKDPTMTPDEIKYQLQTTGVDVYDSETGLTFKRIDIGEAIGTCSCTSWTAESCGNGGCESNEKYYTRTCEGDCATESKCEYDVSCESGISACTPPSCSSGYTDQGVGSSYLVDNKYWTWKRTCYKSELSDWMLYSSTSETGGGWKSDGTVYCDTMNVAVPDDYEDLALDTHVGYSSSSGEQNKVKWHVEPEGASSSTSSCSSHTSSYSPGFSPSGCGSICSIDTYAELFKGTSSCSTVCGSSIFNKCEDTNYWIHCSADLYYNEYEDLYDYKYCDVPYTYDMDIESIVYGDENADCDIEVKGLESNPDQIKIKWYVNDDRADIQNCDDGSSYNSCDDHSGTTWTNSFSLDDSEFSKGDEVYCIARGYSEDGGYGAYVESNVITILNSIPTWTNIDLNETTVTSGFPIKVTANLEIDADNDLLAMYCCNNQTCTPSISNHDFCYAVGDNYPYDLSCIGQSSEIEGNNTVRCRIYDGEEYSSIQSDVYTVNNSVPLQDTNKFYIKNSLGNPVAWLGNFGNIVLKGNCTAQATCTAPANSFIIANLTDSTTAYIDNSGNLCIEKGDCSDESATCNPTRNAFITQNLSNHNMSYIDFDGDLCLTGKLYENSDYV